MTDSVDSLKTPVVTETNVPGFELRRGKVRDIYTGGELGHTIVIVATDRISAFDVEMPNGIPWKGKVLTNLTTWWLNTLKEATPNHCLAVKPLQLPPAFRGPEFEGRTMLCARANPVYPVECVVRGHIMGSGWKDYQETGAICGIELPPGLKKLQRFPPELFPLFTPATKAEQGEHDENITFEQVRDLIGGELAECLRERSITLYKAAYEKAVKANIVLADTKFEFGKVGNTVTLVDEVLTPDSSRFLDAEALAQGKQVSFDKQFARDWLEELVDAGQWNKTAPGPELPDEVVAETSRRYLKIYELLVGKPLAA